jgi:hypothetical protein
MPKEPPPPPPEDDEDELELEPEPELDPEPLEDPGVGPDTMAAVQAAEPAWAGAALVARLDSTSTVAESVRPWESVTVIRKVKLPVAGATTVAMALSAPRIAGGLTVGVTTVHAKLASVRPHAAALPDAFRTTF